jgi:hypothetical protein
MAKKHFATGLLAVLIVTVCAQPCASQSGRGRQLRIAEKLTGEAPASTSIPDDAGLAMAAATTQNRFSLSGNITNRKNARLIYRDNGEDHHPNRADKRAGWILLGFLALFVGVEIANDGEFYQPR